jgi:hypothetical protein
MAVNQAIKQSINHLDGSSGAVTGNWLVID